MGTRGTRLIRAPCSRGGRSSLRATAEREKPSLTGWGDGQHGPLKISGDTSVTGGSLKRKWKLAVWRPGTSGQLTSGRVEIAGLQLSPGQTRGQHGVEHPA